MTTPQATEQRPVDLAIEASATESMPDRLNGFMLQQQRQTDAPLRERVELKRLAAADSAAPRSRHDERPAQV